MAAIFITKLIFHVIARATHDSEHYDGKEEADGDGDPSGEATALAVAKAAHSSLPPLCIAVATLRLTQL